MDKQIYKNDIYERLEASDIPAYYVGADNKIAYKNEAAKKSRVPVRIGAHIRNYIGDTDFERIYATPSYGPVPVSLNTDKAHHCIIQKTGCGFIIKVMDLSALSLFRISRLSEYTRDKILKYSYIINSMITDNNRSSCFQEISKNLLAIVKFQSRMSDYIRLCEATQKDDLITQSAFGSARVAVEAINACLTGHTVLLKADEDTERINDLYIDINKSDFYSLITYLVSFAVRYLKEREPKLYVSRFEKSVIFSIEGESALGEEEISAVCDFDPERAFPAGCEDLMFSILISKALADHYGWRFDIIPSGIGYSRIKALVSVPVSDGLPPMVLHEPKVYGPLISAINKEFADLDR